jgi:hypothetical protein
MIIGLGELVLVAGLSYAGTGLDLAETVAFLLVFATAAVGPTAATRAGSDRAAAVGVVSP